jgi:hypothetical protein
MGNCRNTSFKSKSYLAQHCALDHDEDLLSVELTSSLNWNDRRLKDRVSKGLGSEWHIAAKRLKK